MNMWVAQGSSVSPSQLLGESHKVSEPSDWQSLAKKSTMLALEMDDDE